jgi:hypothetical protein
MKVYNELEKLGFFDWLSQTHELEYVDMSTDYLDGLLLNDIHITVCNAMVFRWFREKYQLHSTITSINQESWQWHIQKPGQQLGKLYNEGFSSYEEAELECLNKLIKIAKNNF